MKKDRFCVKINQNRSFYFGPDVGRLFMKIHEYLKQINKVKNPIKMDRWVDLKQYYLSMYKFYMLKLYDLGYIADPTRFNEVEIVQNLVDMGVYDFKDSIGLVCLKSDKADFSRCKYKGDLEKEEFLNLLYNVLKYKEYCLELDKQFELNPTNIKFSFVLKEGVMVSSLCTIDYNKGVFTALLKDGYSLDEVSFNKTIFDLAMNELGIPESNYQLGMFVKGMSVEDTIKFSNIILEGETDLTGTYGDILNEWLLRNRENGKGLYFHICKYHSNEISQVVESMIDGFGDDFVVLYGDKVYYKKPITKYRIPISMFVCMTTEEDSDVVETDWSALYGYTGESYTKDYLDSQYIDYVGIPAITNIGGIEYQVYDSSQLILMVEQDSWFSVDDMSFSFDEGFIVSNPYNLGTAEYMLVEAYIEGQRGGIYEADASMFSLKDIKAARKKMLSRFVKILNS